MTGSSLPLGHHFRVGQHYRDDKGWYEVVELEEDKARVTIKRDGGVTEYGMEAGPLWKRLGRNGEVRSQLENSAVPFEQFEDTPFDYPEVFGGTQQLAPPVPAPREPTAIERICRERDIRHVVHFTSAKNLSGILAEGLVPRANLQRASCVTNDKLRIDGHPDANCLSLTFPNYRMFCRYQGESPRCPWVVLRYPARILWELPCAFFAMNAASRDMMHRPLELQSGCDGLEAMFADHGGHRARYALPLNMTTDPQAEVMVFSVIPPDWIVDVAFRTRIVIDQAARSLAANLNLSFILKAGLFGKRKDSAAWTNGQAERRQ